MRALVVTEPGRVELQDVPEPKIGHHQALVRITCCGVCNSTDWKVIRQQMPWAGPLPLVLGHESVGVVQQVGERVTAFAVGDQVTRPGYPAAADQGLGSAFGGFAEWGVVTDAQAMAEDGDASMLDDYNAQRQRVVPGDLPAEQAALAISLAETASVLDGLPGLAGRRVLVAGTGVAGLALTLWCKLAGAKSVVTLGRRAERLDRALQLGADATIDTTEQDWQEATRRVLGGEADLILEAVGDVAFARQLVPLLAEGGVACAYGAPPDGADFDSRWDVAQVREQDRLAWVVDLMRRGWVKPQWFLTHRWPMDQLVQAFEAVRRGEVLKGVVQIGAPG